MRVRTGTRGEDPTPSPLRFEWSAPAGGCPTRETVLGRIRGLSGGLTGEAEVVARVEVTAPDAGGWSARVSVRGGGLESTRILTAPSCAEIVDGVVVVIALVLGPTRDPPASEASAAEPTKPPPSEPAAAEPTEAAAAPPREARVTPPGVASNAEASTSVHRPSAALDNSFRPVFGLGAVGLAEAAALPGLSYGMGVLVSAATLHVRAEVGAEIFADRSMAIAAAPGSEGHFGFWSARGGACWLPWRLEWRPAWCAELEWGQMSGRATGIGISTNDAHETWVAAATGPYVEWSPRAGLAILARADAVLPLTPTTFAFDGTDVYRPGTLAARVLAGGELRF
jgi:hypothetical protein